MFPPIVAALAAAATDPRHSWRTTGNATLGDSPTLDTFEDWWTNKDAQYGSIILSVTDSIGNQYASSGWGNSMDYILDLDGVSTQLRPFGGLWNGQRLA